MYKIKELADDIKEELCGAKDYANCYVEQKVAGNTAWANRFKEIANDELRHAMYLHELAVEEINKVEKVINPPTEMLKKWDTTHAEYVETSAWIKQMLTL